MYPSCKYHSVLSGILVRWEANGDWGSNRLLSRPVVAVVCPPRIPKFNQGIEVAVLIQPGKGYDPAIAQRDVRGIPSALCHIFDPSPLLGERVENVGQCRSHLIGSHLSARYQQTAITQKTEA